MSPGSGILRLSWKYISPGAAFWALDGLGFLPLAPSGRASEPEALSGVLMRLTSWWLGFGGSIGAFISIINSLQPDGGQGDTTTTCESR